MDRIFQQPFIASLAAIAIVVASLHLAKPVLMPLAIAVLLSFVLSPLVRRVERLRLGRVLSVVIVTAFVGLLLASAGWLVVNQATQLGTQLPSYRANIRAKAKALSTSLGSFRLAAEQMEALGEELSNAAGEERRAPSAKVTVVEDESGLLGEAASYVGSLAAPLETIGLVVLMLLFILVQREDLRDRIIRMFGNRDLNVTTQAMDEVGQRVSRYLRVHSMLNAGTGAVIGLGLWLIGLPAAFLFGLLSALLRFVPYIGPWVAAALPIALSVAVFDEWTSTLTVIALYLAVELVNNNVFEPWLYGSSVGLSPFAVILSAVFWTWIWGPVGLVLATPLSVCCVVLGRYVPQFEAFAILLSDRPALEPRVRLYQRLLARDADEAEELLGSYCEEHGLEATYEQVVMPALALLDEEPLRGGLGGDELGEAHESIERLVADLVEEYGDASAAQAPAAEDAAVVLCVPARGEGAAIASRILARVLSARGVPARASERTQLMGETLERIINDSAPIVCLSAMPFSGMRAARYLCRRLRQRRPDLEVVVAMWNSKEDPESDRIRMVMAGGVTAVDSLDAAVTRISEVSCRVSLSAAACDRAATEVGTEPQVEAVG